MSDNVFGDVIYAYTRQNAIDDGTFVDVTKTAKEAGVKWEVAVTRNLYDTYIDPENMPVGQDKDGRLWDLLWMLTCCLKGTIGKCDGNMATYPVIFGNKTVEVWAVVEAQSPTDPTPAINIMLPEDY